MKPENISTAMVDFPVVGPHKKESGAEKEIIDFPIVGPPKWEELTLRKKVNEVMFFIPFIFVADILGGLANGSITFMTLRFLVRTILAE